MIRRLCLTGLLAWPLAATPAEADSFTVLQNFGLLGTWSQQCGGAGITDAMILVRFTMTSLGLPKIIIGQPDEVMYSSTIDSVVLRGPDQLEISILGGLGAPDQQLTITRAGAAMVFTPHPPAAPLTLQHCISE